MTTTPSDTASNFFVITITEKLTRITTHYCTGLGIDELRGSSAQTRLQWVEANWQEATDESDSSPFEVVHSKQVEITEQEPDQD